jgi:hypothetical protein
MPLYAILFDEDGAEAHPLRVATDRIGRDGFSTTPACSDRLIPARSAGRAQAVPPTQTAPRAAKTSAKPATAPRSATGRTPHDTQQPPREQTNAAPVAMQKLKHRLMATAPRPMTIVRALEAIPENSAPATPAPSRNAIIPILTATKTATHTASSNTSQQNRPIAEWVEDKPKGEHGGGSDTIDVAVAPSTTAVAQRCIDCPKRGGVAACNSTLVVVEARTTALTRRRTSRPRYRAASPCRRGCPGFPCPGSA